MIERPPIYLIITLFITVMGDSRTKDVRQPNMDMHAAGAKAMRGALTYG
jgi:hypothetical protein